MTQPFLVICFLSIILVSTSGIANESKLLTQQQDNNNTLNQNKLEQSSLRDETFFPWKCVQDLEQPCNLTITYYLNGYNWYNKVLDLELAEKFHADLQYKDIFNEEICECNDFDFVFPKCGRYCSPYLYRPYQIQHQQGGIRAVMSLVQKVANDWPYLISFQTAENSNKPNCYRHFCGGSLITPNLVLTAAHCFKKYLNFNQYEGVPIINIYAAQSPECRHAGSGPRYTAGKRAKVTYMYIHPDWDPFTGNSDIAILVLDTFFEGPYVTLNANDTISKDVPLSTAGYGAVDQIEVLYPQVYIMRQALEEKVDYISYEKCSSLLTYFNGTTELREDTMICAYNINGDTCQGDSGGPLAIRKDYGELVDNDVLVGVISWGPEDQCQNRFVDQAPVVATKVSAFIDWIEDTLASYRAKVSSLSDDQINQQMENPEVEYLEYQIQLEKEKNQSEQHQNVVSLRQQISWERELQIQRVRRSRVKLWGEKKNSTNLGPQQEDENGY